MEKISECVRPLSDGEARQRVAGLAMCFVNQLERVQRLPIGEREVYHRVCFRLYDRLRRSGQLGRRVGGFAPEVKQEISIALSGILTKLHTGTDPIV